MKMKRGLKLLALVGVLSLVIAACGGGEGGDTSTTAAEVETTTSAAAEETTTSAAGETTTAPAEGLGTIEVAAGDPLRRRERTRGDPKWETDPGLRDR